MRDKQTGAGAWLAVWAMGIHTDRPRVTFQSKTLKAKKTKTDQHQPTKDIGERCPSTWTDGTAVSQGTSHSKNIILRVDGSNCAVN